MKYKLALLAILLASSLACTIEMVTPAPQNTSLPTVSKSLPTPSITATRSSLPIANTSTPDGSIESVLVIYDRVNLRDANSHATGKTATRGQVLAVIWNLDGFGEIIGGNYSGLYIWRGCTNSNPKHSGCSSK